MPSSNDVVVKAAVDSAPDRHLPLRGRSNFNEVYRRGERRRVGGIVAICAPGPAGPPQVGVVAGKRVGNAARRNRAKRRLRAALDRVVLPEAMRFVIIASSEVVDIDFDRLVRWVSAATARKEEV